MSKKIISYFLILNIVLVICFSDCNTVYGADWFTTYVYTPFKEVSDLIGADKAAELTQNQIENFVDLSFRSVGFLANNVADLISDFKSHLGNSSMSDVELVQYIYNNSVVGDNNIVFNDSLNNSIISVANDFASSNLSYAYTFLASGSNLNAFANITQMQKALEKMQSFTQIPNLHHGIWMVQRPNSGYTFLAFADFDKHPYLVLRNPTNTDSGFNQYGLCVGSLWDGETSSWFTTFDYSYRWETVDGVTDWFPYETTYPSGSQRIAGLTPSSSIIYGSNNLRAPIVYMSMYDVIRVRYFDMYSDSVGVSNILYQPYYYNNTVWEDFSTSSGDYTLTNNNINTITYGDVTSYVDNDYTDTGVPPSVTNIDTWIENQNIENTTPTPTPTPTGTPGDGGGSGDDDSGSGILDILKNLGKIIADFIKGIGAAITEILSAITEIISSIASDLPTAITGLFEIVFGFLPAEWRAIIGLGITAMIIIGLFKVIRGG